MDKKIEVNIPQLKESLQRSGFDNQTVERILELIKTAAAIETVKTLVEELKRPM